MKIYKHPTNKDFVPITPGTVNMYVCGPTVYDYAHLGNLRPVIVFDLLAKVLSQTYKVNYVSNFTDVDDKIIDKMKLTDSSLKAITSKYESYYIQETFRFTSFPVEYVRVTTQMDSIIEYIQQIINEGKAYVDEGSVRFKTGGFLNDSNPADFVLWKAAKDNEPFWESPWGNGRPGWHVECASIINSKFGIDTIDIHGGGVDLKFPHHHNENLLAEAHNHKPLANYWMHVGQIVDRDGLKLSKTYGNSPLLHELTNVSVIKLMMFMRHYRHPFKWDTKTLVMALKKLTKWRAANVDIEADITDLIKILENDLMTPRAISLIDKWVKTKDSRAGKAVKFLLDK